MRLFCALPIPDPIAQSLLGVQHGVPGALWRPGENFHITLCFYGEVANAGLVSELQCELASIKAPALSLKSGPPGVFGGKEPRALWIGIEDDAALNDLAKRCKMAALRLGLKVERKHYTPHITLAYCRGTQDRDVARYMEKLAGFTTPAFSIDHFSLYRSQLGNGAARYTVLEDYPLRAGITR